MDRASAGVLALSLLLLLDAACGEHVADVRSSDTVSLDSALTCPQEVRPARGCELGAAHARCPGSTRPRAYCSPGEHGCLWISNGCPMGAYTLALTEDCRCSGATCSPEAAASWAAFNARYGRKPWTATRELVVDVLIDATLSGSSAALSCVGGAHTGCADGTCTDPSDPCGATTVRATAAFPGTAVWRVLPAESTPPSRRLQLEVEVSAIPPRARACWIAEGDAAGCAGSEPRCATSGTLTLSELPSAEPLERIRGQFTLGFGGREKVLGEL